MILEIESNLLREGEMEEEQISASVGPPTQNASKEKVPGNRDQTPTKKNESPAKGTGTSSKNRQAQLVQGFQHMVQTLTRPREAETVLSGAMIEGMVEVRAEGEGDIPWCGENPQRDPVEGATRVKGKGSGAAIRTSATRTKSPRGQKRKEVSEERDSTPKKNKGAIEENQGEETPTPTPRNRKGKSPQKRPAACTTEVLVEAPPRKEPKAAKSVRGSSRNQEGQIPHIALATQAISGAIAHIPDEIEEEGERGTYSRMRGSGGRRSLPENAPGAQLRHSTRSSTQKGLGTVPTAGETEDQTTSCYGYQ